MLLVLMVGVGHSPEIAAGSTLLGARFIRLGVAT